MSGVPRSGITPFSSVSFCPVGIATPQGWKLSSRGQGHALGARRPRIKPLKRTDPEGVAPFGPSRAERLLKAPALWVPPPATHVDPLRGARNGQALRVKLVEPMACPKAVPLGHSKGSAEFSPLTPRLPLGTSKGAKSVPAQPASISPPFRDCPPNC